jgi:uncharacterized protein
MKCWPATLVLICVATVAHAAGVVPAYVDTSAFNEVNFTMQGEYPLNITLTTARTNEPNPVVILYSGFSLRDRDESTGDARPFRDIARGLATKGIASIRFDSRAYTLGPDVVAQFDLDKYLLDDLAAIIAYVRMEPDLFDTTKIFIAGHGLGGFVAPLEAQRDSGLAGIILLSAAARPPSETLLKSMADMPDGPASHKEIEKSAKDLVRRLSQRKVPPDQILFFAPARVWYDLMDNNGVKAAKKLDLPFLVLQGGRDKETAASDFSLWKNALSGRKNVRFILYDSLNHLYQPATDSVTIGVLKPTENTAPVDAAIVDDIAAWIKRR